MAKELEIQQRSCTAVIRPNNKYRFVASRRANPQSRQIRNMAAKKVPIPEPFFFFSGIRPLLGFMSKDEIKRLTSRSVI